MFISAGGKLGKGEEPGPSTGWTMYLSYISQLDIPCVHMHVHLSVHE